MKNCRSLIIFCKQPEPGLAKTRLAKSVGNENAIEIYKSIIFSLLNNLKDLDCEIILSCYPDENHTFFKACKDKYNVTLASQIGNNLGERMHLAIQNELSKGIKKVILIGSDCPQININYVCDAFSRLDDHDYVLGPTEDGGYALIGCATLNSEIFKNIEWGSNKVLDETIAVFYKLEKCYQLLHMVRDIDRIEDYKYYTNNKLTDDLYRCT